MTQNTITAGDSTNPIAIQGGDDGTLVIKTGPAGAKVNALSFAADGTPTFLKGPVNVVAFSAYQSTLQSIPNATLTKLQIQTEEFDTTNAFDSTTNYRFQPTVAGYYQISGSLGLVSGSNFCLAIIYKNGSRYKDGFNNSSTGASFLCGVTSTVYFNGSSDYVELWGYQQSGAAVNTSNNINQTWFNGILIAKA